MRRFVLQRLEDETGVSGTGIVAEGVEFADGAVVLRWLTEWPTSVVFHDRGLESVERVHGHGGKTRIVMLDDARPGEAVEPSPDPALYAPESGPGTEGGDWNPVDDVGGSTDDSDDVLLPPSGNRDKKPPVIVPKCDPANGFHVVPHRGCRG